MEKLTVIELFAGVGGFRLGLEGYNGKSATTRYKGIKKPSFEVLWSNQYEPQTPSKQYASDIYKERWPKPKGSSKFPKHSNENIEDLVFKKEFHEVEFDILVGGFPCQDYSVATLLKNSKGLGGKKGVLFWSIVKILKLKKPKYVLLENVDRLLKSPKKRDGRDFAIILQSLNKLGYAVEWRVINAADYGMAQRRRRVFIYAYHKSSPIYNELLKDFSKNWLLRDGLISDAFPVLADSESKEFRLIGDVGKITNEFNLKSEKNKFLNTGVMLKGKVLTIKTKPIYKGKSSNLSSVIFRGKVNPEFIIDKNEMELWDKLKGPKSKERPIPGTKETYKWSEGRMVFPDPTNRPSRTIVTGEGGPSPSRFKHVIETASGQRRRLIPIELERLNMFPQDHTKLEGVTDTKRAFLMGNALVVGVVEKLGDSLIKKLEKMTKN